MNSSVTVTVTVRKQSDDPDAEAPPLDAPAPEEDPLWRRDREYTVMGGGEATDDRFVTETGLFYVEAGIENGSSGSLWLNYGPSRDGAIAGPAISVDVSPDGSVLMDPVFDD